MNLKFRFQHAMEHGQSWLLEKYFGNRYCSSVNSCKVVKTKVKLLWQIVKNGESEEWPTRSYVMTTERGKRAAVPF